MMMFLMSTVPFNAARIVRFNTKHKNKHTTNPICDVVYFSPEKEN
jgi:hypothetical protein